MKKLLPENIEAWRTWLAQHHATEREIWLVFFKKTTGKPSIDYGRSVEEALCFGWIDSLTKNIDDEKYARKFTPRNAESLWSESNKERVSKMLEQGRMAESGKAVVAEAKKRGLWQKSAQPNISYDLPPEFQQSLKKHKKAATYFQKLAPSYQKQYIGWIAVARRPETRAKRIRESIVLLEKGQKLGMK